MPSGVENDVEIFSDELQSGLQEVGVNRHDVPDGRPEQLKLTGREIPETKFAVTVVLTERLREMFPEIELKESEKS